MAALYDMDEKTFIKVWCATLLTVLAVASIFAGMSEHYIGLAIGGIMLIAGYEYGLRKPTP